MADLE
jgi:hypothetical protein